MKIQKHTLHEDLYLDVAGIPNGDAAELARMGIDAGDLEEVEDQNFTCNWLEYTDENGKTHPVTVDFTQNPKFAKNQIYRALDIALHSALEKRAALYDGLNAPANPKNVLLAGMPGVGKTAVVHAWCKQRNVRMVEILASHLENTDVAGVLAINKTHTAAQNYANETFAELNFDPDLYSEHTLDTLAPSTTEINKVAERIAIKRHHEAPNDDDRATAIGKIERLTLLRINAKRRKSDVFDVLGRYINIDVKSLDLLDKWNPPEESVLLFYADTHDMLDYPDRSDLSDSEYNDTKDELINRAKAAFAEWAKHRKANTQSKPYVGVILFLDEYNRGTLEVRNSLLKLVDEHTLNGLNFPDLLFSVAAINPQIVSIDFNDRGEVTGFKDFEDDPRYFNGKKAAPNYEDAKMNEGGDPPGKLVSNPEVFSMGLAEISRWGTPIYVDANSDEFKESWVEYEEEIYTDFVLSYTDSLMAAIAGGDKAEINTLKNLFIKYVGVYNLVEAIKANLDKLTFIDESQYIKYVTTLLPPLSPRSLTTALQTCNGTVENFLTVLTSQVGAGAEDLKKNNFSLPKYRKMFEDIFANVDDKTDAVRDEANDIIQDVANIANPSARQAALTKASKIFSARTDGLLGGINVGGNSVQGLSILSMLLGAINERNGSADKFKNMFGKFGIRQ